MKKRGTGILIALAFLCLFTIGAVLTTGVLKKKPQNDKEIPGILGEFVEKESTSSEKPSSLLNVNQLLQGTLEGAKEVVSQKTVELEKKLVGTIEQEMKKEINSLTQSQIEALKLQICRDLGVITTVPTKQP